MPVSNSKIAGTLVIEMLPNDIKKRIVENLSYTTNSSTAKWVYKKVLVDYNTDSIFSDTDMFLNFYTNDMSEVDASADLLYWIYLRHTGYSNLAESIAITDRGIMFTYSNTTPVFDTTTGAATPLILMPNDFTILRIPLVPAEQLKLRTCNVSTDVQTSASASGETAVVEVAAIINNVA